MKSFTVLLLSFLCLTFIVIGLKPAFAVVTTNTFTEGIHKLSDLNPSKDGIYSVSNISDTDNISIIITDENQNILQVIRLTTNSEKHNTIPILLITQLHYLVKEKYILIRWNLNSNFVSL